MLTHVTDEQIGALRSRTLAPADLVEFMDHLATCADCRARTAASAHRIAYAALHDTLADGDAHISEDDVVAFVDGTLAPDRRSDVSAHLDECARCAGDVRDLQTFVDHSGMAGARIERRSASRAIYVSLAAAAAVLVAIGLGWLVLGDSRQRTAEPAEPAATTGSSAVASLSAADRAMVEAARATRNLSIPAGAVELIGRKGALLGAATRPPLALIAPVGTAVRDNRPLMRWTNLQGATQYVVTVQDASGRTFSSPPLSVAEWTPDQELTRDAAYTWQVAAIVNGREIIAPAPPDPPARFAIVSATEAARFEQLNATPLVKGILSVSAGLLDDAERQFAQTAEPAADAALARSFLTQLRAARVPR